MFGQLLTIALLLLAVIGYGSLTCPACGAWTEDDRLGDRQCRECHWKA